MAIIRWEDFEKVEMRVGVITAVEDFPEARKPAYKLTIDFGPHGLKRSSAQVAHYAKESLLGRRVVTVMNFPPRQIGKFMSEVLVLGAVESNGRVVLLKPDEAAELGSRIA